MNYRLVSRLLGMISLLIGAAMAASLPWAWPMSGEVDVFDGRSVFGLSCSIVVCLALGAALMWFGRGMAEQRLLRKETIAVVGLSWLMATVLGALPFWLSHTCRGWDDAGQPVAMDVWDGLFESASGFSGTGATVLTDLEDPALVPRAILFWRSETHFLGGLGIMVLFVALLGMGSAGKALMRTEMPGPSQDSTHATSQRAARIFAIIFIGMTLTLTILLFLEGMTLYDALCHAFGTIATGGFSTHNASVEYFHSVPIEATITVFMALACVNFTLIYFLLVWQPSRLAADVEFRAYLMIMAAFILLVVGAGLIAGDFDNGFSAVRYGVFQVVSVMTNTGFGTHDFDRWNSLSRGALVLLMFIGGCAGSTSCSVKVIRYLLFFKVMRVEMEKVFRPNVVRQLRLGSQTIEDPDVGKNVLLYMGLIVVIFVVGWILLLAVEPDRTWVDMGHSPREKLVDCASAVAATLNGVGPGLGIVGESENYAHFHAGSKFILTWMMLLGRLEVFVLLVLFIPRFWRSR